MAKFKVGDYIRHKKLPDFVSGTIIEIKSSFYKIRCEDGRIKEPVMAIIDSGWIVDEAHIIIKVLDKYSNDDASS